MPENLIRACSGYLSLGMWRGEVPSVMSSSAVVLCPAPFALEFCGCFVFLFWFLSCNHVSFSLSFPGVG